MLKETSWEHVAKWYDGMLQGEGTYQKELILPNLLRLMDIKKNEKMLDLACGQGFFAREFARCGAQVVGIDASPSLIELARKEKKDGLILDFRVARADALAFVPAESIDKLTIILALQNIENAAAVLKEIARVLAPAGSFYIVLNHPAFRVPKASSWGWDEKEKLQYRRIDKYLSEAKIAIEMHPGTKNGKQTLTFHRPLQFYFKALSKAGLSVTGLEEWNSHKKSEPGPRAAAEDVARKEIPLFLFVTGKREK